MRGEARLSRALAANSRGYQQVLGRRVSEANERKLARKEADKG